MAFTYKLVLEDGTPADPPTFVSAVVLIRPGFEYRILRADPAPDAHGVWTVEAVQKGH